jgi:hypothetical protein
MTTSTETYESAMSAMQREVIEMTLLEISEINKTILKYQLQALINVQRSEEGREVVFHQIEALLSNLDEMMLIYFMNCVRVLSTRALRVIERKLHPLLPVKEEGVEFSWTCSEPLTSTTEKKASCSLLVDRSDAV